MNLLGKRLTGTNYKSLYFCVMYYCVRGWLRVFILNIIIGLQEII